MTIEQLSAGQEVTLEVIIGGSSFEIKTEVVGTNADTGVLVLPYVYNGQVVDFTLGSPKSLSFSFHCIDPHTGGRVVWKNVSVSLVNFKGVDYYAIDATSFGNIAASSERREDMRVLVNKKGTLLENGRSFDVEVIDVSDSGVSFRGDDLFITIGDIVTINYDDAANNSDFSLSISIRIIRAEVEKNGIFYAGKTLEKDKKLLAYLCFKEMDSKVNA